eukprot:g278.t1
MLSSVRRNVVVLQQQQLSLGPSFGVVKSRGSFRLNFRESRRSSTSNAVRCNASSTNGDENGTNNSTLHQQTESKLKQTVADLDAILGIEEEVKEDAQQQQQTKFPEISEDTSNEIRSLAQEISEKLKKTEGESDEKKMEEFMEKMVKIVENATDNAVGNKGASQFVHFANSSDITDGKKLLESLESLLESVSVEKDDTNIDVQKMKDRVFTSDTFWVTDMIRLTDAFGGFRFRGNIRTKSELDAFFKIEAKLKEEFGDKYEVFMLEEPMSPEDQMSADSSARICVQIVPGEIARPQESPNWQPIAAGVLFLSTLATSYILGVSSNINNIPAPVMEYLSQAEHLNAQEWPDFVRNWNASLFLTSAGTIAVSVMFLQLAHDLGHRTMAFVKKIKLKGSLLLPSTQLGTLGSVTQLGSLVKTRQDLWDLAFAGLASSGIASTLMFFTGLLISMDPSTPKDFLVPVPSVLLQGSTLIGGLLQTILGEAALQRIVYLHPFTVAGWCGLATTALNSLPVGNLDGGRVMYSAFGKGSLNISSLFTYAGLALGVIGSSVALPFGLYVLICQRDPEVYIQNEVTSTNRTRQWITALMIALSVFILLPMGLFDTSQASFGPTGGAPPLL